MRKTFAAVLVGTFLLSHPPFTQDGATPQAGTLGQLARQSADVRMADAVPHQDDHGGTLQELACAAGSKAGFALMWRDLREGMLGLYLGRFDAQGHIREPESPIHEPYSGRRLQPALCVDPEGAGLTLWTADAMNVPVLRAHAYDRERHWQSADRILTEVPQKMQAPSERSRGVQLPAAAPLKGGGFAVAWTIQGSLMWVELNPDGTNRGPAQRLGPVEQQVDPGVQLCSSGVHEPLAVWHAAGHLWSLSLSTPKEAPNDLGPGSLVRAVALDDGSAWILLAGDQGSSARRLRADGRPEGEEIKVGESGTQALDLAWFRGQLAILMQTQGVKPGEVQGGGRGGRAGRAQAASADARFEVRVLDPLSRVPVQSIQFLSDKAKLLGAPLMASDGARLLLAWTDQREGDPDVYARLVDPGREPLLGPEFRANTDRASADQTAYRVDANGSVGVVTWIDKRDDPPRAYARRIATPGSFQGDEFLLPGQDPKATPGVVVPSVRADGSSAFLWTNLGGGLRLALEDPTGKPIGDPWILASQGAGDCALTALPADRGWLCAWVGNEPAVWTLRIDPKGQAIGTKRRVSSESPVPISNLAVCFLGGERVALAWDTNDKGRKLRGRIADLDGAPVGEEFELEPSPRKQDWDPALARTDDGGFVVAWTSGAPDDRSRDVVARFLDAQAHPTGPLLWISPTTNEQDYADIARLADGTWAVAWEDDISGYDHTYVRRIQKDRRELGPIMRINDLATKSIQDRVAPRLVPFADGILFAFGDRSRSLGWDARVRVVGPHFDPPAER